MPRQADDQEITGIIAQGSLGEGNRGNIGPSSDAEAQQAADLGNEKYRRELKKLSHCMDDRLEVKGFQLAGNQAITEAAGAYMDPEAEELPQTKQLEKSIKELINGGVPPNFHEGCAALLLFANRAALEYLADESNQPLLISLADARLRLLGVDSLSPNDYSNAFDTLAERLEKDELWDAAPEGLVETAKSCGAEFDDIKGEHAAAAARWDMTEDTFDNAGYRHEHQTDDGGPLGALSVTPGAYKKVLEEMQLPQREIDLRLMRAMLFNLSVLKLAVKEDAPDVIVGQSS